MILKVNKPRQLSGYLKYFQEQSQLNQSLKVNITLSVNTVSPSDTHRESFEALIRVECVGEIALV